MCGCSAPSGCRRSIHSVTGGTVPRSLEHLAAALVVALVAGCGDDDVEPPADAAPEQPDAATPATDAAPVDAGSPDAAPALTFVSGPTFTLAPNPRAPLAGR